ncbi:MAG: S-methyl-5'-thioadenosine phosphorylase, partial [bacterium]|nr:S-methyl-5'-thioadenosine phosphorylase [bacterium]
CYATIALPTDYDCWYESEESVSVDIVVKRMHENVKKAKKIIRSMADKIPHESKCGCRTAAQFAFMTDKKYVPHETLKKLELFYGKYLK